MYLAVPVVISPGAKVVVPKVMASVILSSVTTISFKVTLPVFVIVNVYSITSPTFTNVSVVEDFSIEISGVTTDSTSAVSVLVGGVIPGVFGSPSSGGVPVVVAVLLTFPPSISA